MCFLLAWQPVLYCYLDRTFLFLFFLPSSTGFHHSFQSQIHGFIWRLQKWYIHNFSLSFFFTHLFLLSKIYPLTAIKSSINVRHVEPSSRLAYRDHWLLFNTSSTLLQHILNIVPASYISDFNSSHVPGEKDPNLRIKNY